ncbi:MAG: type II toxin-antitoxin system PemK/MazF family toxin [Nitrososphaera sp.]
MINYKQGDIVTVWFPDSNLLTVKKRPGIVLQKDNLNTNLDQLIIGMVTSNLTRRGHASRIFVDIATQIGQATGLTSNSVIMTDNVATVLTSEIHRKLGSYSDLSALKAAINFTFGL